METTTHTCRACGNPFTPPKRRGRPSAFCSPTCRKAADRNRKAADRDRQRDKAAREHAREVESARAELLTLLDNVNPLPDESAMTPGSYEWHVYALPCLTLREARLYRRLWQTAASPSERRKADMGRNVPVDPARLREAAWSVAEAMVNPRPFRMTTPPALRIDPNTIPGEGARPFSHFITAAEADGFPVANTPMDTPIPYGDDEGFIWDDYATYEAVTYDEWLANGRRLIPKGRVRLLNPRQDGSGWRH